MCMTQIVKQECLSIFISFWRHLLLLLGLCHPGSLSAGDRPELTSEQVHSSGRLWVVATHIVLRNQTPGGMVTSKVASITLPKDLSLEED